MIGDWHTDLFLYDCCRAESTPPAVRWIFGPNPMKPLPTDPRMKTFFANEVGGPGTSLIVGVFSNATAGKAIVGTKLVAAKRTDAFTRHVPVECTLHMSSIVHTEDTQGGRGA